MEAAIPPPAPNAAHDAQTTTSRSIGVYKRRNMIIVLLGWLNDHPKEPLPAIAVSAGTAKI
jgi:hypothetical protein